MPEPALRASAMNALAHGAEALYGPRRNPVASLAGDVESVVKDLGLKRVILVGHSMGGPVSLMAAKRMPGTVIAVIGVDTLQNAELKRPEEASKGILDGFTKDFKGMMRGGFNSLMPEKSDAEVKNWLMTHAEIQDEKMALALMSDMFALDLKPVLQDAKVPVRCINSSGGYQYFTPTAVDVNKKYADFDAVFIDNVGHYPMLEKPDVFNQKLRAVLKELSKK